MEDVDIFCGDCHEIGRRLFKEGRKFQLVFGDPPFNIGHKYVEHLDSIPDEQYSDFTRLWLRTGFSLVARDGMLAVHGNDRVASLAILHLDPHFEQKHWIIWHYRFGQAMPIDSSSKCVNSKAHLLVYGYPGCETTFHPPVIQSDRATVYADVRTQGTRTPGLRVAFDVWGVNGDGKYWGRVQGNNAERWNEANGAPCDHPNQLPEVYVKRVIETFTNPGDDVLVMFGGSGTEAVVAHALGRKVTVIEKSARCCDSIVARFKKGAVRV